MVYSSTVKNAIYNAAAYLKGVSQGASNKENLVLLKEAKKEIERAIEGLEK